MEHMRPLHVVLNIVAVLLNCGGLSAAATEKVSVLAGTDITLQCVFDKPTQWSALTVEWNVIGPRSGKRVIYTLEDGHAHVGRAGASVERARLLLGDASLRIRDVTVGDEGMYTCRVITPVVYTEVTALEVLARPVVSLPETASVSEGEEATLRCDIASYYPQKLDVMWRLHRGSWMVAPPGAEEEEEEEEEEERLFRVCTEMEVLNADGTYSVRSAITVPTSAARGEDLLVVCQIRHQTYPGLLNRTAVLRVTAPEERVYSAAAVVAVSSVTSLLFLMCGLGVTFLLYRHFNRAPLSVSPIEPGTLLAEQPAELRCVISRVHQRELKVQWFRLREGKGGESAALLGAEEDVSERAGLQSEGRRHVASLPVCLAVGEDGARFRCVVLHRGHRTARDVTVRLQVEPSLLQISSIPQIPEVERLLVLCCRVENFYPACVSLQWSRSDGEPVRDVTHFGPFPDRGRRPCFSVWSKMQLLMASEDDRAVYGCRVFHESFPPPGYRDVTYYINTQGTAPSVMFVHCEPESPAPGEECTLALSVRDFCPEGMAVTWHRDGQRLEERRGVLHTPPSLSVNGLYSMWSFLKLTPAADDHGARFTCRVQHSALREPEERAFTLSLRGVDTPSQG